MTELDQAIRKALSVEDAAFLDKLDKETPIDDVFSTFQGRYGVLNVFAALITFALFGVFVYCAWSAFAAPDLRMLVLWGFGASLSMLGVAMLKIYFWMEMHKNQVLREVKRLELQVARLRQG